MGMHTRYTGDTLLATRTKNLERLPHHRGIATKWWVVGSGMLKCKPDGWSVIHCLVVTTAPNRVYLP